MNKTPNNNFLEEEIEYEEVPESEISPEDEVLEEIEEEIEVADRVARETMKALTEAESRIEQANLYKAVLNTSLFAKGSARPEIIKRVEKEFKAFVMYRLEVLLGIKAEGGVSGTSQQSAVAVNMPFSQSEVAALKDIARKLVAKQAPPPAVQQAAVPVVTPVAAQEQVPVGQVGEEQEEAYEEPQRPVRMVKRVVKRTVNGQQQAPAKKPRRPRSNNVSEVTGQDLSQARSEARPPVPMPSASMMNAMNADLAEKNARGGVAATQGALTGHLKTLINGNG
jgi:hypothetical protein